jgi:inosine-uridine nucleoside N-ribohydrolase
MADMANEYSPENPLYIVAIGAITNVASAILLNPKAMKENTVIVWLGGHALNWPNTKEFNMYQDIAAARVVFGCGAPVVQLPCMGVVNAFYTTRPELEYWLAGKNPLADYLAKNTIKVAESYAAGKAWSRVIWDVTAVAWLLNDEDRFLAHYRVPSPIAQYDFHYSCDQRRHPITYVYQIKRDALMTDLFKKLASFEE